MPTCVANSEASQSGASTCASEPPKPEATLAGKPTPQIRTEPAPMEATDLRAVLLAYLHDQERELADPLVGRLLPAILSELQTNPGFLAAWEDRVVRPRRQAIVDLLAEAHERGELRAPADPDVVADLLLGAPLLRLLFPVGLPPVPAHYAEQQLDAIWLGIAPEV